MAACDDPDDIVPGADEPDSTVRLPPGDRSLAGTMQEGRDMMFAHLAGVDMTEADFYWALFHDAVLEDAILARGDFRGAVFNNANLSGANAVSVLPRHRVTCFDGADLTDARLSGATARRRDI